MYTGSISKAAFHENEAFEKNALFCIFNLFLQETGFFSTSVGWVCIWKVLIDVEKTFKDMGYMKRNGQSVA